MIDKAIRDAVVRNHGGFADATDQQILTLWSALAEDTKVRYLAEARPPIGRVRKNKEISDDGD